MTEKHKDQTVAQVAEIFGCASQTVRNWIASGKMKAYQLGGSSRRSVYRIPWAEVERAKSEWMVKPDTTL